MSQKHTFIHGYPSCTRISIGTDSNHQHYHHLFGILTEKFAQHQHIMVIVKKDLLKDKSCRMEELILIETNKHHHMCLKMRGASLLNQNLNWFQFNLP